MIETALAVFVAILAAWLVIRRSQRRDAAQETLQLQAREAASKWSGQPAPSADREWVVDQPQDLDDLTMWSRSLIESLLPAEGESKEADLRLLQLPGMIDEWADYISDHLETIADARTLDGQRKEIRRALIEELKGSQTPMRVLSSEFSSEERAALGRTFWPDEPAEEALAGQWDFLRLSTAARRCLRALGGRYGDTHQNDWYDLLWDVYADATGRLCRQIARGEKHELIGGMTVEYANAIERAALEGQNWNYEPGSWQRDEERDQLTATLDG